MSFGLINSVAVWPAVQVRDSQSETPLMTEPWVSVDVLAQHLGVTKDSVYRWIERKGLPARKIGKLWKFKLSEVDAWVRAGAAGAGTSSSETRDDSVE